MTEAGYFDGSRLNVGDVQIWENSVSFDYGITDYWNLNVTIPYATSSLENSQVAPAGNYDGFGDGRFSLKYQFLQEGICPITLAGGIGLKVPLSNYPTDRFSTLGDNQVDVEFRLMAGRFFEVLGRVAYFNIEGGYRWRDDETDDEWFGYYELGLNVTKRVSLRLIADHVEQLGGIGIFGPAFVQRTARDGRFPLPIVEQDYFVLGLGLNIQLTDSMDLSVFADQTLQTGNSSEDEHVGISIGYKF
ncbi:MAG: hypothetical protein O3B01_22300 [Planctomycetota bacterium]|nr:hypothetical protein [Planctomycetota bacterium]